MKLDALTKVDYSHGGFPHPACISLYKLLKHIKIWKARMLAQQLSTAQMEMRGPKTIIFIQVWLHPAGLG